MIEDNNNNNNNHDGDGYIKYPRSICLFGTLWERSYDENEKRYFWICNFNGTEISSWNPWMEHFDIKAPWIKSKKSWTKFINDETKREYWYNYAHKTSSCQIPTNYESEEQIDFDSADDNN